MNAPLRFFASFMVLCLFSQTSWVQGQAFQQVRLLKAVGAKTKEVKAHLIVAGGSIRVLDPKSARTLREVPYSEIKAATYSFSKHRRWRAGLAVAAVVHVFATPLFFMKGKKHWLTFEMEEDYLALRLDKSNFEGILSAVDRRLKDTTAFDGYRDGASRSGMNPPTSLENKGESPLDKKRILVADQSRSRVRDLREDSMQPQEAPQGLNADGDRLTLPKATYSEWSSSQWRASQMPRELREWITAYFEDLPNFICDYTETRYGRDNFDWKEKEKNKHQGEVRYIDGRADYRVVSENGVPTGKTIWEVTTASPHSFQALRAFLDLSANYRFTPQGEGEFSFQSDAGGGLVRGYTKDGRIKPPYESYPSRGTLWVREPQHRVREVMEYFTVPEGRWLRAFMPKFTPGEYSRFVEYGPVNIGEKSYWLMKQLEFKHPDGRTIQTYENCRRFQVKSTIQYADVIDAPSATPARGKRYDPEVAAAQPGFKRTAGGTGGELPTPTLAHETELEVDADLDSAKLPNLSPQDPSSASPPLSKAVRTSPKRPPPSGRTPNQRNLLSRFGYRSDPDEDERRPFPSPPPQLYQPELDQPEPEPEDDQSGLWWVVLMSGIAAFAGGFFGNP